MAVIESDPKWPQDPKNTNYLKMTLRQMSRAYDAVGAMLLILINLLSIWVIEAKS